MRLACYPVHIKCNDFFTVIDDILWTTIDDGLAGSLGIAGLQGRDEIGKYTIPGKLPFQV